MPRSRSGHRPAHALVVGVAVALAAAAAAPSRPRAEDPAPPQGAPVKLDEVVVIALVTGG